MTSKSKVTSKGQVTIPSEIRKALQIQEGDYLIFEAVEEYGVKVNVSKSSSLSSLQGSLLARSSGESDYKDMKEIRKAAYDQGTKQKYEIRED